MNKMYQPRGSLARSLYEKCLADEKLKNMDKNEWYRVTSCELLPELKDIFVQLSFDEETNLFLEQSITKSSWVLTQVWHCLMKTFLNVFMTQTSINGLLRRGSMFVFSREQFLTLSSWEETSSRWNTTKPKLLDLGAGDGVVTSVISNLFDEVCATEVSPTMKWILSEKGFRVLDINNWTTQPTKFEVITCLNLLDRCDRPLDILQDMKKVLQPNGIVVLAMVLPFKSYVEVGNKNHLPSQLLNITGCSFEEQLAALVENILQPAGYTILRWSKLPYLCEGDLRQSYYWLDDAVFVLKVTDEKDLMDTSPGGALNSNPCISEYLADDWMNPDLAPLFPWGLYMSAIEPGGCSLGQSSFLVRSLENCFRKFQNGFNSSWSTYYIS